MGRETEAGQTGVLLLNLGGPDTLAAVEPFLYNLFSDREIIQFPGGPKLQPLWARLLSLARGPKVRKNYDGIGGGSPLLRLTRLQAGALEAALGEDFRVAIAMRYWRPSTEEALLELTSADIRRVIALTLYPQFSAATTGSSLNELARARERMGPDQGLRITSIDRYPEDPGYLEALAATVREGILELPEEERRRTTILFSAHGLPMKFIHAGDPYVDEINRTRDGVLRLLAEWGLSLPWRLGYQSRTGPVKWTEPRTEEVLRELAREGVRSVLVVPVAFVSDHIETLYEIDQLYAGEARKLGFTTYRRTRMLNDDARYIRALADLVRRHLEETGR